MTSRGVPYVGTNAGASPLAGKMCNPLFTSTSWNNDQVPEAMAKRMNDDKIKTIYFLSPNYQAGKDMVAGALRTLKGPKVVGEDYFRLGESDFQPNISKVRAANPEAVFVFAPGSMGISFMKQWSRSGLKDRIKLQGLDDKFGEILVPTEKVVEMRDGQRRKSERKFFPGYVLVQMEMDDETWHLVKEVPKVLGFIGGSSDKPAPITDKEAQAILNRVQEGVDKPRPKILFEPGEVVRVTDGPFNDFSGVVENVNYEKSKVRVAVQILGRSTPVELDFSQVEKA